jgi:hypothetical protein
MLAPIARELVREHINVLIADAIKYRTKRESR